MRWINAVVGVAHLRDGDLIKQGISAANALPSLCCGIVVVANRGGFGICGINPVNNEISGANAKPLLVMIDERFLKNENCCHLGDCYRIAVEEIMIEETILKLLKHN